MASPEGSKRLVVNADDFGRSIAINQAVIRAHREGILTSASLMVNGEAADDAIRLAHEHPQLGVGLHLTLVCGRSCLGTTELAGLVDAQSQFSSHPVRAGLCYFFQARFRLPLELEVTAQIERFRSTGLVLDHLNGHLHFHLHPTVLGILLRQGAGQRIGAMRLTRDPLWLNLRLSSGSYGYRFSHSLVFWVMARRAGRQMRAKGIRHTKRVFGLLQNGRVDVRYLERLIPRLPQGDSEIYTHPSLDEKVEFEALISPRVRALVEEAGIELVRYQDLP